MFIRQRRNRRSTWGFLSAGEAGQQRIVRVVCVSSCAAGLQWEQLLDTERQFVGSHLRTQQASL